jgi:hypothetical protein
MEGVPKMAAALTTAFVAGAAIVANPLATCVIGGIAALGFLSSKS